MKSINWSEIIKDAGLKEQKLDNIFEHTAEGHGDKITIITRLERAHKYLGQLKQLGHCRYLIFKAMKEKAEKFNGQIRIFKGDGENFILSICTNGTLLIQ